MNIPPNIIAWFFTSAKAGRHSRESGVYWKFATGNVPGWMQPPTDDEIHMEKWL